MHSSYVFSVFICMVFRGMGDVYKYVLCTSIQVWLSLPYFYVFLLYWFLGNGANGVVKRIQALVQCLVYWFGVWGFGGQYYVYCAW